MKSTVMKIALIAASVGLISSAALGDTPPAPGRYAGWKVLSYSTSNAPGGGAGTRRPTSARLGASPSSGEAETSSETWVVRSTTNTNRTFAVRRARFASGGISMCAYSPNRVLATLAAGKSYATFVQEMAARGLHVVRELMRDLDGNAVYIIEAAETENDIVEQMTMSIESTGSCTMVRPDSIYEANAVPNDTNYSSQWGLEKIGAPQAWNTRTDASSVLVAVLDTGVNYDHIDLNRSMWINDGEILGDGIDNDGNGYVDDIYGMASVGGNLSGNPMDDNGHGSHCAGIIGAEGNNRRCVSGVAWKAKIMALKFLDEAGNGFVSDAVMCLRYAEDHGVKIVNCSFGQAGTFDDYLYIQMKKMSQNGTIFVCAAGNAKSGESPRDNDEFPFYPCNYQVDTIVSVAATDSNDALANFSYYGAQNVDIAAPGVDVNSTVLGTYGLDYMSGTSMATPHVTGALALLWAHYPSETPAQIIDRLYAAAEPIPALAGKVRTGARLSMAGFFGIAPPTEISVSQGTVNDAVVLYWAAVANGTHYRVWRADAEDGEKTMLADWRQGLTYSDETTAPGVTNWYFLQAATSAEGDMASTFSVGVSGFRPLIDTSRITVAFNPNGGTVSPASKVYRVGETYAAMPTPTYSGKAFLGWFTAASGGTRLDEPSIVRADATTLYAQWVGADVLRVENLFARQRYPWNGYVDVTFDLFGVPNDETASVSLTAQEEGGNSPLALRTFVGPAPTNLVNGAQHVVWNATPDTQGILYTNLILAATVAIDEKPLLPPANVSASNATDSDAVVVTWSASENATSYEVWRAAANNSASASKIASPTTTSYRDTSAVPATTYWYWVKAVNSKKTSEFSASASGSRKKIPTAIAITGSTSVTAGGNATYTCKATYNDNTTATVTPTWTITSGSSYASINSSTGVLTANGTATQRNVTIQASYSYNGSTQTMTKNVTISIKSVTISFNANGGSVSPTSQSYTAYGTYGSLPTPTAPTGYTFAGWWTASSGGTQVTTASTVPAAATTLWAHWTGNTYSVTLNQQSGSGGSTSATATYGSAMPSITVPARSGYTFGGYYTGTDGSGTQYYTASGASAQNWNLTSATTLYAKWTANTYTIRFNANGGTGAMADEQICFDETVSLSSNGFVNVDHMFIGWSTEPTGTVVYQDGQSVCNLSYTGGAIIDLYAVWKLVLTKRYVVVDLSEGTNAVTYPIIQMDNQPSGGWTDEYLSSKIVLQRVEPGTFMMGSASSDPNYTGYLEKDEEGKAKHISGVAGADYHQVTLTKPFYMGIFKITYAQCARLNEKIYKAMESQPSEDPQSTYTVRWIWDNVSYNSRNSSSYNILTNLSQKTGIEFDLVTDAEWEYVCKASKSSGCVNDWGFYDMQTGGVGEWVRDRFQYHLGTDPVVDPCIEVAESIPRDSMGYTFSYGSRILRGPVSVVWGYSYPYQQPYFREYSRGWGQTRHVGYRPFFYADSAPIYSKSVEISFNGNGGTASVLSKRYMVNERYGTMPTITRSGFVFLGWFTAQNGGNKITIDSVVSASSTTLYAHWVRASNYLVIDLSGGTSATSYPVTAMNSVPSSNWTDDAYKTTKLVLRKVSAGSFTMGCGNDEVGYDGNEATPHTVTISKDFYIGVFEVTQRQYELVMGSRPSYFSNASCYASRPVEQVSWNDIRGNSSSYNWPSSSSVAASSFMGKLRAKTGIDSFDLPTEAKWEYACRAGTTNAFNNGTNLGSTTSTDTTMNALGRYLYNSGGTSYSTGSNLSEGTAKVGSYTPNAWGLYDMHGNVWEWTLDRWQDRSSFTSSSVTDPSGPSLGSSGRVRRGGSWRHSAQFSRSASRSDLESSAKYNFCGFRVSCSVEQ